MAPHAPTAHHGYLQSSNSTASMFLGGVRRSWMDNPPVPRPPATFPLSSSPAALASIPAAAANATATAPPVDPSRAGMRNLIRVPVASSTCRIQQNDGAPTSPHNRIHNLNLSLNFLYLGLRLIPPLASAAAARYSAISTFADSFAVAFKPAGFLDSTS